MAFEPNEATGTAFSGAASLAPLPAPNGRQWHAVYTCAHHERKVADQLARKELECFLPTYESVRQWKDRRVTLDLPLFPGYVFVRFSLYQRLGVLTTGGVVQIVGRGDVPTPIPEDEISTIRTCFEKGGRLSPHPYLATGMNVHVVRGPFAGLYGILVAQKNSNRIVISIHSIQRSVSVEVDAGDVLPLR